MIDKLRETIDSYVLMVNLSLDSNQKLGYDEFDIASYKKFSLKHYSVHWSVLGYDHYTWQSVEITISCNRYDDKIKFHMNKKNFNSKEFEGKFGQYLVRDEDEFFTFQTFNIETAKNMIAHLKLTQFNQYIIGVDLAKK